MLGYLCGPYIGLVLLLGTGKRTLAGFRGDGVYGWCEWLWSFALSLRRNALRQPVGGELWGLCPLGPLYKDIAARSLAA